MSMELIDLSFERDGRPLADWLPDLVDDDPATRLAAGKRLQAMKMGLRNGLSDLTKIDQEAGRKLDGQPGRFDAAVRAAINERRFRAADFVRRLIALFIVQTDDWLGRVEQAWPPEQRPTPVEKRLIERMNSATDEAERTEATRRWMRWCCAHMARNAKRRSAIYAGAESMTAAGSMTMSVFGALDIALLDDRDGLWRMLRQKSLYRDAARALTRIGPAAVEFAWFFLDKLDAEEKHFGYTGAPALGAIGRDDPAVIDALLLRARKGSDGVRTGAILALGHAGPPLAGRLEPALDILLGATYEPAWACSAIWSLASVGRDREIALRHILERASPRPPRWRSEPLRPEGRWDDAMCERGVAISALRHFQRFSAEVVPVLIDAFDSFEEFDPDEDERERVCRALAAFGPDAAAAVPRLARYLDELSSRPDAGERAPNEVCRLLASLGQAASASLPALERLRAARRRVDETAADSLGPEDPVDRAIVAIGGES